MPELSFAHLEGKCYCCGKAGHKSPKCPDKNKPRDKWHFNKVKKAEQQRGQAQVNATSTSDGSFLNASTRQANTSSDV